MDEVKRTYRDAETETKKDLRGIDGTDVKDAIGNAGDAARKDLGNMGDDLRHGSLDRDEDKETQTTVKQTETTWPSLIRCVKGPRRESRPPRVAAPFRSSWSRAMALSVPPSAG